MKARSLAVLAVFVLLGAAHSNGGPLEAGLEAGVQGSFGGAAYDLSAPVDVTTDVLSRLEFPLDGFSAVLGARLAVLDEVRGVQGREALAGRAAWLFNVEASISVTPPAGSMRDYDWLKVQGYPQIPFSYTESDVEGTTIGVEGQAAKRMGRAGGLSWYLAAGYFFQHIAQDVLGYTGWQYVWNGGAYDLYVIYGTEKALTYELTLHAPMVGGFGVLAVGPRLTLEASAFYLLVLASDRDDHVLRYKLSTASGTGNGLRASLAARYALGDPRGTAQPYLALEAQFLTLKVSTTQRQEWYGDDPGTPGDDTGTVYTGIDHVITSTQLRLVLAAGVKL